MTVSGSVVKITELPINLSISDYSEFVDQLLTDKKITDRRKSSSPDKVDFTLVGFQNPTPRTLKLTTSVSTTNLVLFNADGYVVKYDNIESLMDDFCHHRYTAYERRKKLLMDELREEIKAEQLKIDFLTAVLSEDPVERLVIQKNPQVREQMTARGFPVSFLKMSLDSITYDGLDRHVMTRQKVEVRLEEVQKRTVRAMWESDISDFMKAYNKVYAKIKIGLAAK